jgi:hypothetical protein
LARAASPEDADRDLLIAEDDTGILALITRCATPAPIVDCVWATPQGSGAARQLTQVTREWAGARPLLGGPIAARNVSGLRYAAACGYRTSRSQYLYHRWLD